MLPESLRENPGLLHLLAEVYKEINAPVNQLGLDSLKISTAALESKAAATAPISRWRTRLQASQLSAITWLLR